MSVNKHTHKKRVEKGLTIYKTNRSQFWMARFWNRRDSKYVTCSTRETGKLAATKSALEWKDALLQTSSQHVAKADSDEAFEYYARFIPKSDKDDWVLLNRKSDGILALLGNHKVSNVTTSTIRNYLNEVDSNRTQPIAVSTQKKHIITIRKALRYALEANKISYIPEGPKLKVQIDKPRPSFTKPEYIEFFKKSRLMAQSGEIEEDFPEALKFIHYTYVRPTESELMGIKVGDVFVSKDADLPYLKVNINRGKTGYRQVISMPDAVGVFRKQVERFSLEKDDFLWFPKIEKRKYAITKFSRTFTKCLKESGQQFTDNGQKRTAYSTRHYALMDRMMGSAGKINIHTMAKNAGTSVEMLQRFYLKNLSPNDGMIKNLQHFEGR